MAKKSSRRKVIRFGIVAANCLVVIGAIVILFGQESNADNASLASLKSSSPSRVNLTPLDTVSSSEIAAAAAQLAHLAETNAVVNKAASDQVRASLLAVGDESLIKPQVVKSDYFSNKDIKTYIAKQGDTLASIAKFFSLKEDTLRWSNSLGSSVVKSGQKLLIPPVDGIVYTVKSSDTADSLAKKYNADKSQIIAFNDAEISGIKKGERIIIPGGQQPAPAGGAFIPLSYYPSYGSNGYFYGECTWYVATQIAVPSNWHNANTWAYFASRTPGWQVSSTPIVGAIAQTPFSGGGYGHVAIVDAVSSDGSQIKFRDMNGVAGWGRVGYSNWVPTSSFVSYITKR